MSNKELIERLREMRTKLSFPHKYDVALAWAIAKLTDLDRENSGDEDVFHRRY